MECVRPYVSVEGVGKRFWRTWGLRGVSLTIEEPGVYVLFGPNGSGKSTLIRVLLGLTRPTRGRVRVLGLDPGLRPGRVLRRVAAALEGAVIPPYMTGREAAEAVAKSRGVPWEALARAAERLGVAGYWERPVFTYSMGMRKRLLLSLALGSAARSCLLVLDEPYTLLDTATKERVAEMILEASRRIPVIVATHILTRAEHAARRTYLMEAGRITRVLETAGATYECPLTRQVLDWLEASVYTEAHIDRERGIVIVKGAPSPPSPRCRLI